jgi:hypothetical protein
VSVGVRTQGGRALFCTQCGRQGPEGARYCAHCGANMAVAEDDASAGMTGSVLLADGAPPRREGARWSQWLPVGLFLSGLIALVVVLTTVKPPASGSDQQRPAQGVGVIYEAAHAPLPKEWWIGVIAVGGFLLVCLVALVLSWWLRHHRAERQGP